VTILEQIDEAVQEGNSDLAVSLTQQAVDEGLPLTEILNCMVSAMDEIGRKYQCGEAYVPEMLFASRAMKEGIDIIEPLMAEQGLTKDIVAVIGTVQGDLHDLGKNLVIMMWKGANFEVIDLGVDVPPAKFVAAIKVHQPHLACPLLVLLLQSSYSRNQIRFRGTMQPHSDRAFQELLTRYPANVLEREDSVEQHPVVLYL
jgi:5-methyltetrahydrofolate--homocysteine methyltransferase